MAKSTLKTLAQKAKNRLKNVSSTISEKPASTVTQTPIKRVGLANHEYAIIATKIKIEDDPIYNKVIRLLERNPDTYKPLGELIEHNIYDNLTDSDKQRYILNLSKRFQTIKTQYQNNSEPPKEASNF